MEPYNAPEKKDKKKNPTGEAREGLRPRVPKDTKSGDTHAHSAHDGEQDEEEEDEESGSSHIRKRAASAEVEEEHPSPAPKKRSKGKLVLLDSSDYDEDSTASEKFPNRVPSVKPRAER